MSKASERHKEIRRQNKIDLIGLYTYVGLLLIILIFAILLLIF